MVYNAINWNNIEDMIDKATLLGHVEATQDSDYDFGK